MRVTAAIAVLVVAVGFLMPLSQLRRKGTAQLALGKNFRIGAPTYRDLSTLLTQSHKTFNKSNFTMGIITPENFDALPTHLRTVDSLNVDEVLIWIVDAEAARFSKKETRLEIGGLSKKRGIWLGVVSGNSPESISTLVDSSGYVPE